MKIHIGPYRKNRKVSVKIDSYDTWNMDYTLALIILPMLKQLKETSHGFPIVDQEDTPENLRDTPEELEEFNTKYKTSDKTNKRWDYVLDEMIYAFECVLNEDMIHTKDHKYIRENAERRNNGLRLFGKYYLALWDQNFTGT